MITFKLYSFFLPSITNKYLIYIWNLATLKAINPNKYSTLCKAKGFLTRASTCFVTFAQHTHLLLVLSVMTHPSDSQQPGVGGHCACSSLQQSVGNHRGRTSIVLCCSLSHVQLFATPWMAACQASLSFTVSQSLLKLMSVELMMPSNYLILCCPLSSCP